MSRLLSDVLHERAASTPGPYVDVDRVITAGDRRVRRGRLTTGMTAAAVAAVVGASAFALPGLLPREQRGIATDSPSPWTEHRVGYATEDVIHWGDESISVGAVVASYLQTDDGFVYTTKNGDVWLYGGADAQRIGHAENNRLRADDTGSLVAWVDVAEDGHPQYVVYDTHTLAEVARVDDAAAGPSRDPGDQGAEVFAVDDDAAYWRTAQGMVRYDVATGDTTVLAAATAPADPEHKQPVAYAIEDVAAGRIAFVVDSGRGAEMKVAQTVDLGARTLAQASSGVLSPDGRFLGAEEFDNIAVYDTATGAEVTPALQQYPFAVVVGWVDNDTAMVFGMSSLDEKASYPFDMLGCDIPSGDCRVVSSGETPMADEGLFVPPVGDPMG